MSFAAFERAAPEAIDVHLDADALTLDFADGRTLTAPIAWFPRLAHATPEERADWRFTGGGEGIHWPLLDEDISIEGLLAGRRSAESRESLERWLLVRAR